MELLTLHIKESSFQNLHRDLAVAVLRFLGTGDNDARGDVGDPNGRVGGVHVLTART